MIFSKLFFKAIIGALILIVVYAVITLFVFLPHIENHIIQLEERIGKVQLQKTVQIVKSAALEAESYAQSALQAHKNKLEALTDSIWNIVATKEKASRGKEHTVLQETQHETLSLINQLRYGEDDYFFVSDQKNILISHPYLQDKDFSRIKDMHGNLIVPPMVKIANAKGEGFTSYWWKKNNNDPAIYEKLSYVKAFKPWGWVIGTGVYIDNIDKEIKVRKSALISRLKSILKETKIGKTGYVYIFDSDGHMIIHPNDKLQGINFKELKNPETERYIFDDLVDAYKQGYKTLYYLWDSPENKGNYTYKKVSWIEYDPYFDWYICSSGYVKEFRSESTLMRHFIIYTAILTALLITALGLFFSRLILKPVIALSENAKKVIGGDLNARYQGKIYDDETGALAMQHNVMLDTIHEQINTLDHKVQEKTEALSISLEEKEMLLKGMTMNVKNNLFVISDTQLLQAFQNKESSVEEFIETIQNRIQSIAMAHEMLYKSDKSSQFVDIERYTKTLVDSLLNAYIEDKTTYQCTYEIDPLQLTLDQTLSCGLIINELVTNTIKHAFQQQDDQLKITLNSAQEGVAELIVEDKGPGLSKEKAEGVGLELVRMSVTQLEGTLIIDSDKGLKVTISFPIEKK